MAQDYKIKFNGTSDFKNRIHEFQIFERKLTDTENDLDQSVQRLKIVNEKLDEANIFKYDALSKIDLLTNKLHNLNLENNKINIENSELKINKKFLHEKLEHESTIRRNEVENELIQNEMKSKNAEMKISLDLKEMEVNHLKNQKEKLQNDFTEAIMILEKELHMTKSILTKRSEHFDIQVSFKNNYLLSN